MIDTDRKSFFELVADVYAFYRQDCSTFAQGVWWEAMKPYDLSAVKDAFNRHAVNPDNGQYCPKPADIVKLIGGGTVDAALVAWSKVDRAIRTIGSYQTVCFDDPIINAVLSDMGGWIALGQTLEKELPFRAKEFENRYRGYRFRGKLDSYPKSLPGITERDNGAAGYRGIADPVLIGDIARATAVFNGGGDVPALQATHISQLTLTHGGDDATTLLS